MEKFYGTGKRKTAVAKIWINAGDGKVIINKKDIEKTMNTESLRVHALFPLAMTNLTDKFNVNISVKGGGLMGQAGAIRHGITIALVHSDPNLRIVLKRAGLITRDSRIKERKKYGRRGARASFQFSKR